MWCPSWKTTVGAVTCIANPLRLQLWFRNVFHLSKKRDINSDIQAVNQPAISGDYTARVWVQSSQDSPFIQSVSEPTSGRFNLTHIRIELGVESGSE